MEIAAKKSGGENFLKKSVGQKSDGKNTTSKSMRQKVMGQKKTTQNYLTAETLTDRKIVRIPK